MLFGLEILAATYVGNRLLHRPKKRHKQRPKKITKHTICASASPIATSNAASLTEEAAIGTSADHSN